MLKEKYWTSIHFSIKHTCKFVLCRIQNRKLSNKSRYNVGSIRLLDFDNTNNVTGAAYQN